MGDGLVGDCSLTIGVLFLAKLDRGSRNSYDLIVFYESAIASANVKVNGFARSVSGIFLIIHDYNNKDF